MQILRVSTDQLSVGRENITGQLIVVDSGNTIQEYIGRGEVFGS